MYVGVGVSSQPLAFSSPQIWTDKSEGLTIVSILALMFILKEDSNLYNTWADVVLSLREIALTITLA